MPTNNSLDLKGAVVSKSIVFICGVVWALQLTTPGLTEQIMLNSESLTEPHRFVTSMFAHTVIPLHIIFNMYALLIVGSQLERYIGKWRFILTYFVTGLAGGLAYFVSGATIPAVGASGAIFGLLGFALVLSKFQKGLLFIVGINLVIGFVIPGIAWQAHLGGFAAGALLAFYWHSLFTVRYRIGQMFGREVKYPIAGSPTAAEVAQSGKVAQQAYSKPDEMLTVEDRLGPSSNTEQKFNRARAKIKQTATPASKIIDYEQRARARAHQSSRSRADGRY